jgi:uncharacterized membrane protein YsdA (DUF1294 family)/cold shock CspA family protein
VAKDTQDKVPSDQQHGVVVMFDADRGFGFIRPDGAKEGDDRDVFVHVRNVEGHKNLHPGQSASYYLTGTDKGLAAINVQPGSVLGTPYLKYSLIGVVSAVLLLFGLIVVLPQSSSFALWVALWVVALSIVTFGIYGFDKAQAQSGGGRVPEAVLHLLGLLGGTPGAFIAMRVFRHKTSKRSFQIVFWVIVAVQLAALLFWVVNLTEK